MQSKKKIITCRKLILKEEEGEIRTSYNLQTGRFFFLFFLILHCFVSYHQISLLLVLRVSVSVFMRVLGNFGHGGSVGHTGGLDRTDSICISVEGGASTGTTAWV